MRAAAEHYERRGPETMTRISLTCPDVGEEEVQEVTAILRSGRLDQGCYVEALEHRFAELVGVRHAVAMNTGTAALHVALLARGVGPGDRVIAPALCELAVLDAICQAGATPVLVDVDPYTYTISTDRVAEVVTENTKALVAVHLFGQPCECDRLQGVARRHGLQLINVAWDALGATYKGEPVGARGTSCFSFQLGRAIVTGEGGMLTTDSEAVAMKARRLRNFGLDSSGEVEEKGFNYRMTDLTAGLALRQVDRVALHVEAQNHVARTYTDALTEVPALVLPSVLPGAVHAFQQYVVRVTDDSLLRPIGLVRYLRDRGIESDTGRRMTLSDVAKLACGGAPGGWPTAAMVARQLVFLPMHTRVDLEAAERVIRAVREVHFADADGG